MPKKPNPFVELMPDTHEAIEKLFTDLYAYGEFEDEHFDLLDAWREARGESGMTDWHWWVGYGDNPGEYSNEHPTRDAAIADGRINYVEEGCFSIIEARQWADGVQGDENDRFAQSRSRETIKASANDG